MVECLPRKHIALTSVPSYLQRKRESGNNKLHRDVNTVEANIVSFHTGLEQHWKWYPQALGTNLLHVGKTNVLAAL